MDAAHLSPMSADLVARLNAALEGRYRIESKLGEGGMATVYRAADLKHERDVALKVLKPGLAAAIGPERFLAEIKTTANLQHPSVLPLHDSGVADGHVFYAMPHVRGASLKDRIASEGPLPLDDVARIASAVGSGLAYAHAQGIIHRDVKPGNILLSEGHAVLADFGLAKAMLPELSEGLTDTEGIPGTVRYMSPEQIEGKAELDGRADQYSLACVVYEMLTGEPPFTGRTPWEVIARQMNRKFKPLSEARPEAPSITDSIIKRALDVSPSRRFADTEEFTRTLSDSLSGRPVDKSLVRSARSRAVPILLAVTALALVGAALFSSRSGPQLDDQRVIVFPLMDQRADRVDQAVGEQVAIMVGTSVEHAEPLRWVDGWDWLSPAERTDMASWSIRNGTAIARDRGARYVIDGRIMDQGDSASVLLRLHDAESGGLVQTSLLAGPADDLPSIGRQALVALLPSLIDPGRPVGTGAFEGFEPAAVADWLNGEREYRESRFAPALESFSRAVEADSTMALAALRGAQAARWLSENPTATELLDIALANESSLSPRDRLLAQGIRSYFDGEAAEAERILRETATRYPDWSDAWMALGEVYYHLMPTVGSGDVPAEDAFRRALLSDPGFTPPLVHLSEIAFRKGDSQRGDSLRLRFRQTGEGSVFATHLDLMSTCVRSDPTAPEWSTVAGTHEGGEAVLYAGVNLGAAGAYPACAIAAFEALASWGDELEGGGVRPDAIGMAWSTLLGRQSLHSGLSQHERVNELIAGASRFERPRDYLWALAPLAGLPLDQEASEAVERLEATAPEERSPTALWSIGAWHAHRGDPGEVALAVEIARNRSDSTDPDSVAVYSLLGDVLDAWSSLARADTSEALARFSALSPASPPDALLWSLWEPLAAERLALTRLRLATGDFEGAIDAAAALDHPQAVIYVAFLAESLRLRLQAAEQLGDPARAATYRERLDRLH